MNEVRRTAIAAACSVIQGLGSVAEPAVMKVAVVHEVAAAKQATRRCALGHPE